MSQSDVRKSLTELVEKQAVQISALMVCVENLERELSFYKNRKDSSNSHIPPSVDLVKRNQSLREKSAKSRGYKTIAETFPNGLPDVLMVHDRWDSLYYDL